MSEFCLHTTNPLQVKSLCSRCMMLDKLNILVYQMPACLGGDWAARARGYISDGFRTKEDAEKWALAQVEEREEA